MGLRAFVFSSSKSIVHGSPSTATMSIWDLLPDELCGIIFDHVGDKYQEIVNFRRVSQRFKALIDRRNTSRVEKRKRMDFVEDEGTSQDLWQRCRDTFAARKRQRLATDIPPRQLVLPICHLLESLKLFSLDLINSPAVEEPISEKTERGVTRSLA